MTDERFRTVADGDTDEPELSEEDLRFREELLAAARRLDRPSPMLSRHARARMARHAGTNHGFLSRPKVLVLGTLAMAASLALGLTLGRAKKSQTVLPRPEPLSASAPAPSSSTPKLPALHPCNRRFRAEGRAPLIDDFEDGDGASAQLEGRGRNWMLSFDFDRAGAVERVPVPERLAAVGPHGRYAVHFTGERLLDWGAVLHLPFWPNDCYDASAYAGLTFWAKGPGRVFVGAREVRVVDVKWGGTCEENCYNVHSKALDLERVWRHYRIPWAEMLQRGYDMPPLDPSSIHSIQFLISAADTPFDLWVDDVAFLTR